MRTPFLSPNRRLGPASLKKSDIPTEMADNLRGVLLMATSMAAFACNDTIMKAVTQEFPLYQSVAMRGCVVLAFMLMVARFQGKRIRLSIPPGDRLPLVLRTGADIVSTVLYLLALREMALADISAIMQSLPLAVTLAAALVFRERLGWRRLAAIGVGFVGVLLILRPGGGAFDLWSAAALASMLLIVVRDLSTRVFSAAIGTTTIAFYAAMTVTVSGFIGGLEESWRFPRADECGLLLLAAVFLTVGYHSAVATMRVGEIAFVAPFRYTSLIWAILLGLIFFGEWPDLWTWAGSILVVGAGIYSILRERQLGRRV
ncbi:DMT family transporter [Paracoccus sp. CPCC 101403]|uniref:DMT family transporter n=2 Tax=Paracoccus broussonetiae TaxID=3075834 RepID=A0ABU3E8C5_9RHOB|nr:DMT family transporter [Paracoccus sp. CPCC 101403]MDT1060466.1 DMT family transporter [Paracoccus sp. CPCC 101403]